MAVAEQLVASQPVIAAPRIASAGAASTRYFVLLFLLGLAVFVLGVGNRFTAGGLFVLPPPVDWIPPLTGQSWNDAFAVHQQDPAFAACGGTETLAQYRLLYWWEWLRRASLLALIIAAATGLFAAAALARYRVALPRLVGIAVIAAAWWPMRIAVELAIGVDPVISSFNVGQYRHAVDVAFASAALAAILASAIVPPRAGALRRAAGARDDWLWVAIILVDLCFGALFASCNAAASWPTWPGYGNDMLPPLAQLVSYSRWWLNLTFNPYGIQLAHRAVSTVLWVAALWQLGVALWRGHPATRAAVRFGLISAQAATGIAALVLAVPAALSIVHQVGGVILLAAVLAFWLAGRAPARANSSRSKRRRGRVLRELRSGFESA
jgi:cytochrome c oxidase assembly protein subunit 15